MGAFLKIFITFLSMGIFLSIAFPGSETQFLDDNLFSNLLEEETDPLTNESYYSDLNSGLKPEWSEGGNQESSFLQKFIDGLSVVKTTIKTLINLAVLPITIATRMQMPAIIRILIFIPLAILYLISGLMTLVRGVQP